jgi:NTE family protein
MGLEPVRKDFQFLLVSDGGHPLSDEEMPELSPYARVTRSLDIINNQVGAQRKRWLIDAFKSPTVDLDGAYWGLGSKVSNYGVPGVPSYPNDLLPSFENVRTDLDSFSEGEIGALVNHGYALANVAANRWVKPLLPEQTRDFRWPFDGWIETEKVKEALRESGDRGIIKDLWNSMKRRVGEWF